MSTNPPQDTPPSKPNATPLSPRDRLIASATQLFGRYGINAVGVDTIVEAAGTAKTTLYKAFGSKEGLVEAVLEEEGSRWRAWFLSQIDGPGGTAQERLNRVFPALGRWFAEERFFGCPFTNAVGEHDKYDAKLRRIALDHKRQITTRFEELLSEAGFEDPESLTEQFALLMDGAIVAAMISRDPRAAEIGQWAVTSLLSVPKTLRFPPAERPARRASIA